MIVRVVKMTFEESRTDEFINMFEEKKNLIRGFSGCDRLELLRDKTNPSIFFTYSFWDNEESLNLYRHSDTFKEIWAFTKSLFADKAEAWSLNQLVVLT